MTQKHLSRLNKRNLLFIAFSLIPLCVAVSQNLKTDSLTDRIHNIPNVTIKAHRAPNKVTSTIPVQTFRKENIDALGIQSISDAVRRFTGTEVKDYGGMGGLKTVSVRNMGGSTYSYRL